MIFCAWSNLPRVSACMPVRACVCACVRARKKESKQAWSVSAYCLSTYARVYVQCMPSACWCLQNLTTTFDFQINI